MKKRNTSVGPELREEKTKSNTVFPGCIMLLFIGSLSIASQYFAYLFQYQSILGAHFNYIYPPWSILIWTIKWSSQYPNEFREVLALWVMFSCFGMLILMMIRTTCGGKSSTNEFLHGSARWANKEDIELAGLLQEEGVYVGSWQDKDGSVYYLRHNGPEHILTYAPTRSGKTIGLVIPTLLSWKHSALITDLKGELWALTAGWRKHYAKNKVLRFEPATANGSVCWNPLAEIRIHTDNEVSDVQNLATLIVDPDGKGLENHWQKTAQALLVGLILYAIYKDGATATLASVDAMLADPKKDISKLWDEMIQYKYMDDANHPVISATARDMLDRPEEETGSVLSTAKSYLSLYRDPIVAKNTSKSDFCIKDLMNHRHPVSLYIVTQPNDKNRLRPLIRMLLNNSIRLLADKMDFKNGRAKAHYLHRLLLELEEFPSYGKLDIMQESLAFIATYGIKCHLICQDIPQLKSRERGYGPDETITSNCLIQNAYPPNRVETAEHLSKLTGITTVFNEQVTISGKMLSIFHNNVAKTRQPVQRALLTVDEALRMRGPKKDALGNIMEAGDMIIQVAGCPAIYGKQPLYFQDPIFQARAEVAAPTVSDKLTLLKEEEMIKL